MQRDKNQLTVAALVESYTVQHDGGSSLVTVSQAQRGGQWNELGVFTFTGGQDTTISLSDDANGSVAADALRFV